MASPAEIIAARVNGTYLANDYEDVSAASAAPERPESSNGSSRSVNDESAFPVLGQGSRASTPATGGSTLWGPNAPAAAPVAAPALATPVAKSAVSQSKFKGSTIQEAFSLDAEDQLNVTRPEFIKILTSIKTTTQANIECTTSQHTKKRTFLITGKPEQVKLAKRLVIKKLTKPVSLTFNIPAKVRSKVIGAQGRNLKPIIQENEVKIDIGHLDGSASPEAEDEDDIYAQTVEVTIDGDAEGSKRAKSQILAIVKEETKNLLIKVTVDDLVKPFVEKAITGVVGAYPQLEISVPPFFSSSKSVIISGDREAALEARDQIKEIISQLENKLVIESVPIPKIKHQFLPIESILELDDVLIKLPEEGETDVKFIGEKNKIAGAKEKARQTTSQYKVEVLDMSKAHKGNLSHVRAIAAFLNKNGAFSKIASENDVAINPPTLEFLKDETQTSLPIEIVVKNDDVENTKNARRSIVSIVNSILVDQAKVVADIDPFFISKVPETLESVQNAQFVILNDKVILFDVSEKESGEDFDDFEDSSSDAFEAANKALDSLRELQASLSTVVLKVASNEQSHISGPSGTTLKSILAAVEPKSVTIKLHSNVDGKSANEVLIHGLKTSVNTVAKDIETILAEAEEYKATGGYKASLEVPTFVLSRVIGKGGANLNNIRDDFGVKIDIVGEAKDRENVTDKSLKTEIIIAGIKRNAEEAKNAIVKLAKKLADDTVARLRIENQYHRRIVGPSFTYINRLQDKYNVKIRFPSENNSSFADAPKNKDEVTIRGPSKNVAKAEEELKELYEFEKENGFKSSIQIPIKAVARVIGRNGETIRDIADGAGVEYRFNRDRKEEEELGYAEVELTGSKSALKEASQKIKDIVEEAENFVTVTINVAPKYHRDLVGTSGSVMREIIQKAGGEDLSRQQYARLLTIPNEGSDSDEVVCQGDQKIVESIVSQIKEIVAEKEASVAEEYDLAKEKHKLIVGPGGSIRHALQDEFKVQINIPRPNDKDTIIKLFGLPENIEKLKAKLDETTKDNWNESIDIPARYHALVSDRGALFKTLRSEFNVEVSHGNLTRKASNLSNSSIATPPEGAEGDDSATTKFTIGPIPEANDNDTIIPWRLIGEPEATAKAAAVVTEQFERAKNANAAAWFYSSTPSNHFPKIIGPQGRKINQIRKSSGAFITVPRLNEKHKEFIYLVGTEESLQKAQDALNRVI